MKAIAMQCTQEQFNAIKDKLVGCEPERITDFNHSDYLTNAFQRGIITNLSKYFASIWTINIHETWNEEIFLNACRIETERIFKGSEIQYKNFHDSKWNDGSCYEYRLKPDNTIKKQELESQILQLQNQLKNL
jgi:hypothetical protein